MREVLSVEIAPEEAEQRVDRWFRRRFPHLSQGQIEKLLRTGQIRVGGARAKASDRLTAGQVVRIPPLPDPDERPARTGLAEKDVAFVKSLVLHRDADVIAINKPAGLAVQGGPKVVRHLDALMEGLTFEADAPPKLVHRLDRDTSGVLLLARHPRAAAFFARAFRERTTEKIYWAVILGAPRPASGEIRGWMRKTSGPGEADREMVQAAKQNDEGAVFATTEYVVLSEAGPRASWVALKPATGRTHQLRYHMAEIGHAILGDPKYTCDRPTPGALDRQLHLHARALRLAHPNGSVLKVIAPLPEHMKRSFDALGFNEREARDPFAIFET
jgi:23S rRNA pseudouridine955/2504/2580 synthase